MAIPAYLKPADTLGALQAGDSAGSRNPLNVVAAMNSGADAGSARARLQTSHDEALARNALEAQQQANQIAMARERNAQQQVQAKMEMEARQKTQEQQALKEDQRIKIQGAYQEQQLGIQQQRLQQAEAEAAAKAQSAAMDFAAKQSYANDRAAGMSNEKALWNNPRLLTPGTMSASSRPIPKLSAAQEFSASPVMQQEEQETEEQIRSGIPPLKAIQDHPTLIQNPPFDKKWGPIYRAETLRKERAADKPETDSDKWASPTKSDIALLILNPHRSDIFEKKFGPGTSKPYLPQGGEVKPATTPDEETEQ